MFKLFGRSKSNRKVEEDKQDISSPEEILSNDDKFRISIVDVVPRDTQYPLRGPKKRFSENIDYNLLLLRERFPDTNLVFEQFRLGSPRSLYL